VSPISRGFRGHRALRSAMRLKLIRRSARRRALVDAAVSAYAQWRGECAAVRVAYRRWVAAGAGDNAFAFYAYNDALDREEHAAKRYARLISRAGGISETGLWHQLARIEIGSRLAG
jgi:hypothetical protein